MFLSMMYSRATARSKVTYMEFKNLVFELRHCNEVMKRVVPLTCFTALMSLSSAAFAQSGECLDAPALPPIAESDPGKTVVVVEPEDDLRAAVSNASDNTVLLIEPGVYQLTNTLVVNADNLTIRGNSDRCDAVRIIGLGMDNADAVDDIPHGIFTRADYTKVQNLTIEDVYFHAITITAEANEPHIYNVGMFNIGEQFVKVNSGADAGSNNGRLEYSVMKYTDGTPLTDHGPGIGYTQGISLHNGDNWVIRNNLFENFSTPDDADFLYNPVVLAWNLSKDTVVENNVFIDVDRAIAFGLSERGDGLDPHSGGIIRNNMVVMRENLYSESRKANTDAPIIVWGSPNTQVSHNTIITNGNTPLSIETRFNIDGISISNNLSDAPIRDRLRRDLNEENNVLISDASIFQDAPNGDLHLKSEVEGVSRAVPTLANVPLDIDGQNRGAELTDAGADELNARAMACFLVE